jgi:hypothetical protein
MTAVQNLVRRLLLIISYPTVAILTALAATRLKELQGEFPGLVVFIVFLLAEIWLLHSLKKIGVMPHAADSSEDLPGIVSRTNSIIQDKLKLQNDLEALASEKYQLEAKVNRLESETRELTEENLNRRQKDPKVDLDLLGKLKLLAQNYIQGMAREILERISVNNLELSKKRMDVVFLDCDNSGVILSESARDKVYESFREQFKDAVRRDDAKEEQRLIREKIREEERAQEDFEREMERIRSEEQLLKEAIEEALAKNSDEHTEEIRGLRAQLAEAERKMERTISMAEITSAGHVYVISNFGSFGENIFKVGLTRRLEPLDRVRELSSASVPFPFDVHMMISCEDAPALEKALHKELNSARVNKVNLRKEFFKTDIKSIVESVAKHHGNVEYAATAEALDYTETKLIEERGDFEEIFGLIHDATGVRDE